MMVLKSFDHLHAPIPILSEVRLFFHLFYIIGGSLFENYRVYRSNSNTFELELINRSINRPFLKKGTAIELTGMAVTVLNADKEGAKCIEFRFNRSLDDPSLKFLAWIDEGLKSIQMPPIGQSIFLDGE